MIIVYNDSRLEMFNSSKKNMGLIMFIVGFLGLTFLITSGCILYFKQMDESEEEKSNYTILRKLGFTQGDLLKGIQAKQIFNFGIPLVIGRFSIVILRSNRMVLFWNRTLDTDDNRHGAIHGLVLNIWNPIRSLLQKNH